MSSDYTSPLREGREIAYLNSNFGVLNWGIATDSDSSNPKGYSELYTTKYMSKAVIQHTMDVFHEQFPHLVIREQEYFKDANQSRILIKRSDIAKLAEGNIKLTQGGIGGPVIPGS